MQENYKILVVDDDARLRSLLERYLSEHVAWQTVNRWTAC